MCLLQVPFYLCRVLNYIFNKLLLFIFSVNPHLWHVLSVILSSFNIRILCSIFKIFLLCLSAKHELFRDKTEPLVSGLEIFIQTRQDTCYILKISRFVSHAHYCPRTFPSFLIYSLFQSTIGFRPPLKSTPYNSIRCNSFPFSLMSSSPTYFRTP